jgi:hypothetical protein
MNVFPRAAIIAALLAGGAAHGEAPHGEAPHGEAAHGEAAHGDEPRHRPSGVAEHAHAHAHPGVDLTHPIVTESPLPETHLRVDYNFGHAGSGQAHALTAAAEYAFTPNLSLEAVLPYVVLDPDDDAGARGGIGDVAVAVKLATYALVERHVVPAIGIEAIIPTGDEERGIGSDHVLELEPFVRVGYWAGPFEFIGALAVGIPLNQSADEADEEEFALAYNLSSVLHLADDVQALIELHGESIFGDADETEFQVSPGVTFQPFPDKSITIGVGASLPLTSQSEFDYVINFMTIVHF